jgi:O-antigen biosynthesis protein
MPNDTLSAPSAPKDLSKVFQDKPVAIAGSLVSILIPCCGMLEYTQLCVASVFKHTRAPYELIFLDIGSLDGTADFLAGLAMGLQQVRIEVVRTPTDLGIPTVCRDALDRCRGEFMVLLNNDTIVTRGWVNKLIGLLSTSPAVGVVGPMSNYAVMPQLVETVSYRSGPRKNPPPGDDMVRPLVEAAAVQAFADTLAETNKGKWVHADRLGGFCLMMKREVCKQIMQQGQLDKWTDLSLFDTDILSTKAKQYGYNLAVCRDVFIHHFGTRTFAHGSPAAQAISGNAQPAA